MSIIKLTRGFETIIDDDLFEELNCFKWYASGPEGRPARRLRAVRRQDRRLVLMYHQILNIDPNNFNFNRFVVDHIDRNPLNNRRNNLRIVSRLVNSQNSLRSINRIGVGRDNRHNTWKAYIDNPNKFRINIGTFKTKEEAEAAVASWRSTNV